MRARLILIVIPTAVLLQSGCGIDASTATKSSETAANSPSGYGYLSTCAWKFIGQDLGTVEKCLEWHMSDNLTPAQQRPT